MTPGPLRLGLLSTARINRSLVTGAGFVDEVDVVAIGSRDAARAREQARELGVERAVGSYEALLEDPGIDAVYVSLPNGMHVDWSIRALEAGKHVLCEKPMSRHPAEIDRAYDAAEQAGRVLMEAFMWRHHPQTAKLVELLPEVGALRTMRAAFSFNLGRPGDVRFSAALEGGALMDVGCYCVSGMRLVAGEPERVAAEQVLGGDGVDVRLAATLRFSGDVVGHFDCAFDSARRAALEIVGETGTLYLADPWSCRSPGIELWRGDGEAERVDVPSSDPYAWELRDLAAAASGQREALLGRADAAGQARTIAALYESAASGNAVAP